MHQPISLHKKSQFCSPSIPAGLTIRISLHPWLLCSSRDLPAVAQFDISSIWFAPFHLHHCLKCSPEILFVIILLQFLATFLPPPAPQIDLPIDEPAECDWSIDKPDEEREFSIDKRGAVKMYQGCNFLQGGGKIENLACAHAMGTLSNARGTLFRCHRHLVLSPTLLRRYSIQSFLLRHGSLNQIGRIDTEQANCFCLLLPGDEIS